jgi:hypothetical protein
LNSIPASIAGIPQAFPSSCCGSQRSVRVPHVRTSVARISYYAATAATADGAFSQRKPHAVPQRHNSRQEIRDTWAENDGRSPSTAVNPGSHRLFIRTEARPPIDGCPILRCFSRRVGKPTASVKCVGIRISHPSQRARRMGHPNINLGRRLRPEQLHLGRQFPRRNGSLSNRQITPFNAII